MRKPKQLEFKQTRSGFVFPWKQMAVIGDKFFISKSHFQRFTIKQVREHIEIVCIIDGIDLRDISTRKSGDGVMVKKIR